MNTDLEGAFYFSTARVSYAVSGPAKYDIMVAYNIDFVLLTFGNSSGPSTFGSDYSGPSTGSPVMAIKER